MCALWDGAGWEVQDLGTSVALWSVAVAPDGRAWTTGPRASVFFCGEDGWEEIASSPVPLSSVAFWNERVWLAAGGFGLFELRGGSVVQADKDVHARHLEARGNLIAVAEDALLDTVDGESFRRVSLKHFRALVDEKPPGWQVVVEEPDIQDDDDPEFADDFDDDEDDEY